ncbi:MAG: hypothetical protein R3E12_08570 [Candidatus Eisenbacteria bacterium]
MTSMEPAPLPLPPGLLTIEELAEACRSHRAAGERLVFTNSASISSTPDTRSTSPRHVGWEIG